MRFSKTREEYIILPATTSLSGIEKSLKLPLFTKKGATGEVVLLKERQGNWDLWLPSGEVKSVAKKGGKVIISK